MAEPYIELFQGDWLAREDETGLVRRHLTGLPGRVLDLGCGPGYWTGHLHDLGVDVTGIDIVPEFIAHARATHPECEFQLGSMIELGAPDNSVAGILSWYSTIHLTPRELEVALAEFRRLLRPDGTLVIGFFDSEDGIAQFDHKVFSAYRWPADVFSERLTRTGFAEVERTQKEFPERPDRKYAAIAACTLPT